MSSSGGVTCTVLLFSKEGKQIISGVNPKFKWLFFGNFFQIFLHKWQEIFTGPLFLDIFSIEIT
jgi:hypothetical protein